MKCLSVLLVMTYLCALPCVGQNPAQPNVAGRVGAGAAATLSHEKQEDPNVLKVCASQAQAIRVMLEGSMKQKGLNEAVEAQVLQARGSRNNGMVVIGAMLIAVLLLINGIYILVKGRLGPRLRRSPGSGNVLSYSQRIPVAVLYMACGTALLLLLLTSGNPRP